MALLGYLSLWLACLVGLWGAITGFVGGAQGRADLQQSARHATFALFGALAVAVISLEIAIFRHDFTLQYVVSRTSRNLPTFYLWSALYSGQEGSLLFWAAVLSLFAMLAQVLTSRRYRAYLPYVAGVTCLVATFYHHGDARSGESVQAHAVHAAGRSGDESAAAKPGDGVPSADAVPRLHLHHDSVRVRDRGAAHQKARHRVDGGGPEVDSRLVALPERWAADRDVVGLRGAGVGRLLGLGSGGKRGAAAVARHDRLSALRDGSGKAWDAEEVESGADPRRVGAVDLRHVPHALRCDRERAFVHGIAGRLLFPVLPRRRDRCHRRPLCHPASAVGSRRHAGINGESRGELP